jgi:hypothetical protein
MKRFSAHRLGSMGSLLLTGSMLVHAGAAVIVLHLPSSITFQSFSNTGGSTEIRLSADALAAGFPSVPAGANVQLSDGACVIRVPITDGPAPGFQILPAANGALALEMTAGPVAAPASGGAAISNPPPPANPAPIARREPPPSPTPGLASPAGAAPPAKPPMPASAPSPMLSQPAVAATPAGSVGAADVESALVKLFPELGPVGFDPVAKADYALPEPTAATAIGASNPLVRPSTPREVVTSLLTNFDKDGKLQAGLSFAITPYTLLRREPLTADLYERPGERFLANLQLSAAARPDSTVVVNGQTAARYSTGLSMVFFDDGDLRRDRGLLSGIASALHQKVSTSDFETSNGMLAPIAPEKLAQAKKLWDDARAKHWNDASAAFGVAPAWLSFTGKLSDAQYDGLMTWSSLSLPGPGALSDSTQFILGGNGRFNQQVLHKNVITNANEWTRTKVIDYAAQLRYGSESFNFFVQGTYRRSTFWNDHHRGTFVYEIGAETRVATGVWINLAWSSADTVSGASTIRSGVRYGFGSKAVLAPPPGAP